MWKWIAIICILFTQTDRMAAQAAKPDKKKCQKVTVQINKLNSQLRQANSVARGEKLKDKLRGWKKLRYQCQKRRIPIK